MPVIIAGDTNIPTPPTDPAMGPLYGDPLGTGDFWEIEQERDCVSSPTCDLAQGGQVTYKDKKLDYVFASRWYLHIPVGRVSVNYDVGECGVPPDTYECSDHAIQHSEVVLPTT